MSGVSAIIFTALASVFTLGMLAGVFIGRRIERRAAKRATA